MADALAASPQSQFIITGTINGNQIDGFVISMRRIGHICAPGQHATLTMSPDWPHGSRPGLQCFLYENGEQVMKGFIIRSKRSRPSHEWVIEIDDTFTLVNQTFLEDQEVTTPGHDTAYWAGYILEKCGATWQINGVPAQVPPGIQIGLRTASESLKDIIAYASWYAWPDKTGKIQIGRFDRSISGRTVTVFDDFEYDISDDMTRNQVKVYGNGRIFAEETKAVHGIFPDRIAVVGSPLIATYAEADRVAQYLIAEIGDLTKVIRGTIPGNPKIKIGNVVTLTHKIGGKQYSVTDTVTSLEMNFSMQDGYTMNVSVGERCPRISGYSEKIPYVYAGTNGNGVYVSRDKGLSWAAMNSGLPLTSKVVTRIAGDSYGKALAIINGGLWYETGTNWMPVTLPSPGGTPRAVGSLGGMDSFAVLTGNNVFFSIPSSGSEPPDDPTVSSGSISGWTSTQITTQDFTSGSTLYGYGLDMYTKTGTAYVNAVTSGSTSGSEGIAVGSLSTPYTKGIKRVGLNWVQYDNEAAPNVAWGTVGASNFVGSMNLGFGESAANYDVVYAIGGVDGLSNGHISMTLTMSSLGADPSVGSIDVRFPSDFLPAFSAYSNDANLFQLGIAINDLAATCGGNAPPYTVTVTGADMSPFFPFYTYIRYYPPGRVLDDCGENQAGHIGYIVDINRIEWVDASSGSTTLLFDQSSGSYNLYTVNADSAILVSDIPAASSLNDRLYVSDDGEVALYKTGGRLLISDDFGGTFTNVYPVAAPTKVAAVTRAQVPSNNIITSGSYYTNIAEVTGTTTTTAYQGAPETAGGWNTDSAQLPASFVATDMIWSDLSTQGVLVGGGGTSHTIYRYDPQDAPYATLIASDGGIPTSGSSAILDLEFGE